MTALHTPKKVFIGMSGGVDSSVSALLLKEAGYDVTGVFLKVWQPDFMECSWKEDRRDAMRVAAQLGIPFLTINAEKEYKEGVVDYMVSEYKAGRTPNPDVMCNNTVKFGLFFKKAMEMGADYIATGHYARRIDNSDGSVSLGQAVDTEKDQTYFLWNIPQNALDKTLFPIGEYKKSDIRKIAQKNNLYTSDKKDSQGLCFIGKVSMKDFLSHFLNLKDGDVLDSDGKVIGRHNGSLLYTIGQRHGFTITEKTPDDTPYYVVAKDIEANTITVDTRDSSKEQFEVESFAVVDDNWLTDKPPLDRRLLGRIRHRQPLCPVMLHMNDAKKIVVQLDKAQKGIAIGQSLVVYEKGICIGGAIINEIL